MTIPHEEIEGLNGPHSQLFLVTGIRPLIGVCADWERTKGFELERLDSHWGLKHWVLKGWCALYPTPEDRVIRQTNTQLVPHFWVLLTGGPHWAEAQVCEYDLFDHDLQSVTELSWMDWRPAAENAITEESLVLHGMIRRSDESIEDENARTQAWIDRRNAVMREELEAL